MRKGRCRADEMWAPDVNPGWIVLWCLCFLFFVFLFVVLFVVFLLLVFFVVVCFFVFFFFFFVFFLFFMCLFVFEVAIVVGCFPCKGGNECHIWVCFF